MELRQERLYTYQDYLEWPEDERWEIIEGVPYAMAAAPLRAHQEVSMQLAVQIGSYLKGKACKVYAAPFAVKIDERNVVEPDIVVVCDPKKLTRRGCEGAPDWVIEILSPGNTPHDKVRKLNLYLKAGVREYWIVDPVDQTVNVLLLQPLEKPHYAIHPYGADGEIPVGALEGLKIDMKEVFPREADVGAGVGADADAE